LGIGVLLRGTAPHAGGRQPPYLRVWRLPPSLGMDTADIVETIRRAAWPLDGHEAVLAFIGDARIVVLGAATHGSREFDVERAALTMRLVDERGFDAVCIEGDATGAQRVHRHLHEGGNDDGESAAQALAGLHAFPAWRWRHADFAAFVQALRGRGVAFHGLDLYAEAEAVARLLAALDAADPALAAQVRERCVAFDRHGGDTRRDGLLVGTGAPPACEQAALSLLVDRFAAETRAAGGFVAAQATRLMREAERHFGALLLASESTWNLRERHLAQTLDTIDQHLRARLHRPPRLVVWAHSTDAGDTRATERGARGDVSLGQHVRQRHGAAAVLIGLTTHEGWLTAATRWGGAPERLRLQPAPDDSLEALLHRTGQARFLLPLRDAPEAAAALQAPRPALAVGAVYAPAAERPGHHVCACLPRQFDAVIHIDSTDAALPLDGRAAATRA
jgi:erythromycin esterase-like protein